MDIGDCAKVHDLALRADYERESKKREFFFEFNALDHLESFISDCDRRTEQAKRRLKDTQDVLSDEATVQADEIHRLGEEIGTKLAKAEQLGADGNVEESLALMKEVEELNKVKGSAEGEFRQTMPISSYQQQKLRVCEVCCAYLGIHDNDRRLADHFGGKLHLGFIAIREKLDELRLKVAEKREERDKLRDERRRDRVSRHDHADGRDTERDTRRHGGERRSDSSRHHRRHRSRSRDRRSHGHRSRSRSRERHRRHRSRDHRDRGCHSQRRGGSPDRSGAAAGNGQPQNGSF